MENLNHTEKSYYEALQRLIDRNEAVSLNAVAIEAGKKQGSLRAARYPELVSEIKRVIEIQNKSLIKTKAPKFEKQVSDRDQKLIKLERQYHIALQRVISLERQVFELQKENMDLRKNINNVHNFPNQ